MVTLQMHMKNQEKELTHKKGRRRKNNSDNNRAFPNKLYNIFNFFFSIAFNDYYHSSLYYMAQEKNNNKISKHK